MNDTTELRRLLRQRYRDMGDTLTRQAGDEIERLASQIDWYKQEHKTLSEWVTSKNGTIESLRKEMGSLRSRLDECLRIFERIASIDTGPAAKTQEAIEAIKGLKHRAAAEAEQREHVWHKCAKDCSGCQYCLGGLAFCEVCRKGEAELDKHCPGPPPDDAEQERNNEG